MIAGSTSNYQDLLIISFIGAFVTGAVVFVIATPVTNLRTSLFGAGIAFLVVLVLLAIFMGVVVSRAKTKSKRSEDVTSRTGETPPSPPDSGAK